jgi:hypothetical protein
VCGGQTESNPVLEAGESKPRESRQDDYKAQNGVGRLEPQEYRAFFDRLPLSGADSGVVDDKMISGSPPTWNPDRTNQVRSDWRFSAISTVKLGSGMGTLILVRIEWDACLRMLSR